MNVTGKLFTCEHCKEMTLADETETRYILKLTFKNRFQHVVTMYSPQLIQYFQRKEKSIPQNQNELVLEILSDKFTRIVVDSRSEYIGIKQLTDA